MQKMCWNYLKMEKPKNIATLNRYSIMRGFIPKDCSNKIILDIGAGLYPISKGIKCKKIITLDGDNTYKPEIIMDLNTEKIPLKNNSVDIVIAGEIIEHIFNPVRFLSEINRILKYKGTLILSTPNICSLKNRLRMLFNLIPEHSASHLHCDNKDIHHLQDHVGDFNTKTLSNFLKKTGFFVEIVRTNGIIFRVKKIFPLFLTPSSFGEIIILRARKINSQ